jgi:hypothetical protein
MSRSTRSKFVSVSDTNFMRASRQRPVRTTLRPFPLDHISISFSRVGAGVYIQRSDIPGAGYGLFASIEFKKNDIITRFDGYGIMSHDEANRIRNLGYASHLRVLYSQHDVIDGFSHYPPSEGLGGGSYCNHGGNESNSKFKLAVKYGCPHVYVVATKDIYPAGEILTDYGRDYWK